MLGANTRSVLAKFCDNNWEKEKYFVKTFFVRKPVWERGESASARWMTCWDLGNGTVMSRKANFFFLLSAERPKYEFSTTVLRKICKQRLSQ